MDPLVSVIIPTYNSAQFLPTTLDSILGQTYKNLEVIVVDDGSTDNTSEVVSRYDSRINVKYIYQSNSGGPSRPRNKGIEVSSGEIISVFDSDDIMHPEKIIQEVRLLRSEPTLGMVFTNFVTFNESDGVDQTPFLNSYSKFLSAPKRCVGDNSYIIKSRTGFETLFYENYIGTSSVLIPVDVLRHVGIFYEEITNADDRDMWFRISTKYDVGFIDMLGHYRRLREDSISRRGASLAVNRIRVFRRHLGSITTRTVRRQAHKLISQNLVEIAYDLQQSHKVREARRHYYMGLWERFSWTPIKGLITTYVPSPILTFLKATVNGMLPG